MTQLPIYHETPGQGHTGWPLRGNCLVLDEAHGLEPLAALAEIISHGTSLLAAKRIRRPTLSSVAKQARKAAIAVTRYEVKPDGSIVIVTAEGEPIETSNPWLVDLAKRRGRR
jgi:hypothetical protein